MASYNRCGKKDQAVAVALSLTGKYRDVATELSLNDLNTDNGMHFLFRHMDTNFKKESADNAFECYEAFENTIRQDSVSINDYILNFERSYNKASTHGMVLPESVKAFKLLKSAGLQQAERRMVLSNCTELKYDLVKSALKRTFESVHLNQSASGMKSEPCFGTNSELRIDNRKEPFSRFSDKDKRQNGTNPVGKDGRITRCARCGSTFHWLKNCTEKDTFAKNVQITTSAEFDNELIFVNMSGSLMSESLGKAVIDTGCTATVAGIDWIVDYLETLPLDQFKRVQKNATTRHIAFGDASPTPAIEEYTLPVFVTGNWILVSPQAVECKVPLLLSQQSTKAMKANIDLATSCLRVFGAEVPTVDSTSGHLLIDLTCFQERETSVLFTVKGTQWDEQQIEKLHKQFGHCSCSRLYDLMHTAFPDFPKGDLMNLIEEVSTRCDICEQFGRSRSKPAVGLPLARSFNECLSVHLHKLKELESFPENLRYLHIIDQYSHFSATCLVHYVLKDLSNIGL